MTLKDALAHMIGRDAKKLTMLTFQGAAQVSPPLAEEPIRAGCDYFRLRLCEMFLQQEVHWFTPWSPAVHTVVRLSFGNKQVDLPYIADMRRLTGVPGGGAGLVAGDYMLTPAIPFQGGTVDLDAGLLAIPGRNQLATFVQVLSSFSGILAMPQLSVLLGGLSGALTSPQLAALQGLGPPLTKGIEALRGAGGGRLHLAAHQSYAAGDLRRCYLAVIRAARREVDPARLWVVQGKLREGDGPEEGRSAPYERYDHMLLMVDGFSDRDDWESLSAIEEPYLEARRALKDGDEERATFHLRTAKLRAKEASELTSADRRRVVDRLEEKYAQDKADFGVAGLIGGEPPSLAAIMRQAMPVEDALALGEPTLEEVFAAP